MAVDPRFLEAYSQMGRSCDLAQVDAAELAGEQEELSWAALQQRTWRMHQVGAGAGGSVRFAGVASACLRPRPASAQRCRLNAFTRLLPARPPRCCARCALQSILLGHLYSPDSGAGTRLSLNPSGAAARTAPQVWNGGDGRCKLLLLAPLPAAGQSAPGCGASVSCTPMLQPAAVADAWYPVI